MHIDRPPQQSSLPSSQTPTTTSRSPELTTPEVQDESVDLPFGSYTEPISEGEEDEQMDVAPVHDEARHTRLPSAEVTEAIRFREEALRQDRERDLRLKEKQKAPASETNGDGTVAEDESDEDDTDPRKPYNRRRSSAALGNAERPRNLSIDPLAPASQFDKSFWSKLNGVQQDQENGEQKKPGKGANGRHVTIAEELDEDEADDEAQGGRMEDDDGTTIFVQSFRAEPGKKISVPVRIEPKVIFANERTFMVRLHPSNVAFRFYQPTKVLTTLQSRQLYRNGYISVSSLARSQLLCSTLLPRRTASVSSPP